MCWQTLNIVTKNKLIDNNKIINMHSIAFYLHGQLSLFRSNTFDYCIISFTSLLFFVLEFQQNNLKKLGYLKDLYSNSNFRLLISLGNPPFFI